MAISWTDDRTGAKSVSHEGLVVGPVFRNEERVMSDIYAYVTRVWVWNPITCKAETVVLNYGFELNSQTGVSEVDATPEVAQAYNILKEAEERAIKAAREKYEAEQAAARAKVEAAKRHDSTIVNGCNVMIVAGKKEEKGQVGRVFWKRDGRIGVQIGDEKLPNGYAKHVVWTCTKNVVLEVNV